MTPVEIAATVESMTGDLAGGTDAGPGQPHARGQSRPSEGRVREAQADEDRALEQLVPRLKSRDHEAFNELYLRLASRVRHFALGFVADSHTAEDLTQAAFERAWDALPRYEQRGIPLRVWIFRLARNAAVDHLRRQGGVVVTEPAAVTAQRDRLEAVDGDESLERVSSQEVVKSLARLSPKVRRAFVLRTFLDLDYDEIARVTGQREDAARRAYSRACAELRRKRAQQPPERPVAGAVGDQRTRVALRSFAAPRRIMSHGFSAWRPPRAPRWAIA